VFAGIAFTVKSLPGQLLYHRVGRLDNEVHGWVDGAVAGRGIGGHGKTHQLSIV